MPHRGESETELRAAYHRMFVRFRDQKVEEVRGCAVVGMAPDEIDRWAWRQADDSMRRMLAMRSRNDVRRKRKRGEAA